MTYNELVTAVQDYCENVFETVDMNTFIQQAEQRIFNVAQPANQRKNVTGSLTAGGHSRTVKLSWMLNDGSTCFRFFLRTP